MTQAADTILDRIKLKKSLLLWRLLAIILIVTILIILSLDSGATIRTPGNHIARINIEGIIFEDQERDKILKELAHDNNVKAVIVYINSPGGTVVGGENIYHVLRDIGKTKPVVAVMGSLAASGGYMAAIAADRIFARAGSITGSVGVLMQSFDITKLGDKLGVGFLTFKSGSLKATPSPFEKITPAAAAAIDETIKDSFALFLGMVQERRALKPEQIDKIKDGRIFTGRQALEVNLIDALGGEEDAVKWLQDNKNISKTLDVIDVDLDVKKKLIEKLMSKVTNDVIPLGHLKHGGLMALWSF